MDGSFEPGSVFADRYVIQAQLGGGAAGVVLSATHTDLKQRVAIKLLKDRAPVSVERMIREARAALSIHSEHVVRVMDVGRDKEGHAFIVMEQLEGCDLGSLLQQKGCFPVAEAVDYVLQACAGISEAHARGIVHRDLKPSNLFLTRRADNTPLVKVLDFGISKTAEDEEAETSLTGPEELVGSPRYMSPEQVRGARNVDHRTDLWALGVILFRFLSGVAPFGGKGKGISGALTSVVMDDPPSLAELVPGLPRGLEAAVLRCLAKAPENRYESAAEMAVYISPFGSDDGRAAVARLIHSAGLSPESSRPGLTVPVVPAPAPARPSRRLLFAALAAGVVAIPVAAVALLGHDKPAAFAAQPPSPIAVAPSADTAALPLKAVAPQASESAHAPDPAPAVSALAGQASALAGQADPAASAARHGQPQRPASHPRAATPGPANTSVAKTAATDDRY
jgi:serine/threonine-protein kinase